jgi:hypothetical protein
MIAMRARRRLNGLGRIVSSSSHHGIAFLVATRLMPAIFSRSAASLSVNPSGLVPKLAKVVSIGSAEIVLRRDSRELLVIAMRLFQDS